MHTVKVEYRDKIALITLNRPEKRNALNRELRTDLSGVLSEVDAKPEIRVAIITGAGKAFAAGADIAALQDYTPEEAASAAREGSEIFHSIEKMRIPVIAAVNGWALGGGCELAMACDIRICSEKARFGQPEIRIGIMPGYGANIRLPLLIGPARAKELMFTGRIIDAAEAERLGLVNFVVPEQTLMEEVLAFADRLARGPAALGLIKKSVNGLQTFDMDEAIRFSSRLYGKVYETADAREGIAAFLEKRDPNFTGE